MRLIDDLGLDNAIEVARGMVRDINSAKKMKDVHYRQMQEDYVEDIIWIFIMLRTEYDDTIT